MLLIDFYFLFINNSIFKHNLLKPQTTVLVLDGETGPTNLINGYITTRRCSGRRILVLA